ncbi:MAG: hypothetical protein V4525_15025 [Pseudomonadota bacterium]
MNDEPKKILTDTEARVAFDLMITIAVEEHNEGDDNKKGRDYWLTLYHQCRQATANAPLKTILEASSSQQ